VFTPVPLSFARPINVNISIAFLLPRYTSGKHKGQCNTGNNATPVAASGLTHGTGTEQFG
jgi:hypothetical protein